MQKTNIPWTDYTTNPSVGCELPLISDGCRECYARKLHNMRHEAYKAGKKLPIQYAKPFEEIQLFPERLDAILRKKTPCKIFVGSMTDLFCPSVPFEFIAKVFYQISICYWHTFQILTKRPERVLDFYAWVREQKKGFWWEEFAVLAAHLPMDKGEAIAEPYLTYHANAKKHYYSDIPEPVKKLGDAGIFVPWPPPNFWFGGSISNQPDADRVVPILLQIPAAKRFVSVEPMLGQVDIDKYINMTVMCPMCNNIDTVDAFDVLGADEDKLFCNACGEEVIVKDVPELDWVIIGCESGPKRRPCKIEWVRDLVNQCKSAGVAPFVKQLEMWRDNDSPILYETEEQARGHCGPKYKVKSVVVKDITKFPKDLQIREYPE